MNVSETSRQQWDAQHYDAKLGFVSAYGQDVVALLQPQAGERILDLGCGTGDLAASIAETGAEVEGFDSSKEMIEEARRKYPQLSFWVANAEAFKVTEPYDAVFSNAALHWMKRPRDVIRSVWDALKPGGRFVAEFGGKGNVQTIVRAVSEALSEVGIDAGKRNPWFYPSLGEYATLLEHQGLRVAYANHFARPTRLADGEQGLENWLRAFAGPFMAGLDEATRRQVVSRVMQMTRSQLWRDDHWIADYYRLRILAIRP